MFSDDNPDIDTPRLLNADAGFGGFCRQRLPDVRARSLWPLPQASNPWVPRYRYLLPCFCTFIIAYQCNPCIICMIGLSRRHRGLATRGSELTPLYPGYGTHFSYVYVGTPGQRQSVIIDTGSQFTAFPCTGRYIICTHTLHT